MDQSLLISHCINNTMEVDSDSEYSDRSGMISEFEEQYRASVERWCVFLMFDNNNYYNNSNNNNNNDNNASITIIR